MAPTAGAGAAWVGTAGGGGGTIASLAPATPPLPSAGPVEVPGTDRAIAALAALRSARRRRRLGDVAWGDLAYRVYTTSLASLVLTVFASGLVGDVRLDTAATARVTAEGPAWAGLLAGLALVVGVRSGARSGPLALEAADVHHLLLAPVERSRALRTPAVSMLGYSAAAGAAVGALAGLLLAQRLPGPASAWMLCGAAAATAVVALSMGAAMVTASRRVPRWLPPAGLAVLLAWTLLELATPVAMSPLGVLGSLVFWPLRGAAWSLVAVAVAAAVAVVGVAVVGGLSIEAAQRRTRLVGQLRFAVTQQDLRSVLLLRRQLASERPRSRPRLARLPRVVERAPILRRDLASLLRWPTVRIVRVLALSVVAGLALRAAYAGTTPLVLAAGILTYVAALDAVEPLAQEVDHPTLLRSHPVATGRVLVGHLVAPTLVMLALGLVSLVATVAVAPSTLATTIGAVTVVSGAMSAVAGAAISVVSEETPGTGEPTMLSPEVAGPRVIIRTLWPPLVAVSGLTPVLAAQRAVRAGQEPLPATLVVAGASLLLCGIVAIWVRRREDWHRSMGAAMRGETPVRGGSG